MWRSTNLVNSYFIVDQCTMLQNYAWVKGLYKVQKKIPMYFNVTK